MSRNPIIESIGDPSKNFLAFLLIGIFGLGVISSGISNLLLETLGTWIQKNFGLNKVLFQVGLMGLISLAIVLTVYFTSLARKMRSLFGHNEIQVDNVVQLTDTFAGLIAIASFAKPGKMTPAEIAIRHHWREGRGRLRYCWLICTPDALESTKDFIRKLEEDCERDQLPLFIYYKADRPMPPLPKTQTSLHIRILVLEQQFIHDPNHTRQLVAQLYEEAEEQTELRASQIIADYTGGTKSMTAGMVLACSDPDRGLQYLASQYDAGGKIIDSQLMKVTLSYRVKRVKT